MKATKNILLGGLLFAISIVNAQNGTVKSFKKIKKGDAGLAGIDFSQMRLFGASATNIGDIDKDGILDIAVRGYNKSTLESSIYILFLKNDGTVKSGIEVGNGKGGLPTNFTTSPLEGFGVSIEQIGDFDNDGVNEIVVGNHGTTNSFQGELYLLYLNTNGTVKSYKRIAEGVGGFSGQLDAGDGFGSAIANLGDIDGDGIIDIAVGAVSDGDLGPGRGAVWILFLNSDGTVKSFVKHNAGTTGLTALQNYETFGQSATNIGDLDNNGVNDIIVGAPRNNDGGTQRGAVRVLLLNSDGSLKSVSKISQTAGNFTDSLSNDALFGSSVSNIGDLDGDGVNDICVGATAINNNTGAIWNIFLKNDGTVKSFQKITSNTGGFNVTLNNTDIFGTGIDWLGDINGDGMYDILVTAPLDDEGGTDIGALYVLFLNGKSRLSAEDIYKESAVVYPNPANSNITVNLPEAVNNPVVEIITITGQKVWERQYETAGNTLEIVLPELEKGVYTVKIYSDNILYYNKLLISR